MMSSRAVSPVPFSRLAVIAALALAYATSLLINVIVSFQIADNGAPIVEFILSFMLAIWIGASIAESDNDAITVIVVSTAALISGISFFHWQFSIIFWIYFILLTSSIFFRISRENESILHSIATILMLSFVVGTSLLIFTRIFLNSVFQNINIQLSMFPLIDVRILITIIFVVISFILGIQKTIHTFSFQFTEIFRAFELKKRDGGSFIDGILTPFTTVAWVGATVFCYIANTIVSFFRTLIIFFIDVGSSALRFAISILGDSEIWISTSKFMLTFFLFAILVFVVDKAAFNLDIVIINISYMLDIRALESNSILMVTFISTMLIVSCLFVIWRLEKFSSKGISLALAKAADSGVWLFLCIWLAAATSYVGNSMFNLHPRAFAIVGIFTLTGFVLVVLGVFAGVRPRHA